MKKFYKFSEIPKLNGRKIFFDANVLIYIFWPAFSKEPWINKYSAIFKSLLTQNNEIVVDFIVISEVINRALRLEYEKYLQRNHIEKKDLSFKDYRKCPEGKQTADDIYEVVKSKIVNQFKIADKAFTKSDIEGFLHYLESNEFAVQFLDFFAASIFNFANSAPTVFHSSTSFLNFL